MFHTTVVLEQDASWTVLAKGHDRDCRQLPASVSLEGAGRPTWPCEAILSSAMGQHSHCGVASGQASPFLDKTDKPRETKQY